MAVKASTTMAAAPLRPAETPRCYPKPPCSLMQIVHSPRLAAVNGYPDAPPSLQEPSEFLPVQSHFFDGARSLPSHYKASASDKSQGYQ